MVFILAEFAVGYALLNIKKKFKNIDSVNNFFKNKNDVKKLLNIVDFRKFTDMNEAIRACKMGINMRGEKIVKPLRKILKINIVKKFPNSKLYLENPKLGSKIYEKFNIVCQADDVALEFIRNIREHLHQYITGLDHEETKIMHRGLAHHFSRFKLQFSVEKEDYMIIQAIKLLEDLDKCLNQLAMRLREWFGINFPEMAKIVNDNIIFAKIVKKAKTRNGLLKENIDFSEFIEEPLELELKHAAKYSMGTRLEKEDINKINNLAQLVIDYNEDRNRLNSYLTNRMQTIAPNLTIVVGEKVGAKLIAHASSLVNLAKCPASTLQIMGAEKSLFRALKKRTSTPKFGHIYHSSLIGSSDQKIRGKIARTLACKASISARIDAFDSVNNDTILGAKMKRQVEKRIDLLTHYKIGKFKKNYIENLKPVATITKQYQSQNDIITNKLQSKKFIKLQNLKKSKN